MPASTAAKAAIQWRRRSLVARPTALAALALLAIGGCGSGNTSGNDGSATVVDMTYSAGGSIKKQTLDCATPTANDKPSCMLLAKLPASAFKPVPKDAMCTMIFGGPETATIKGTVNGTKVDAKYARSNGCEISRWDRVEQLFAELAGN